jgi:hypothetical protein
MSLWSDELSLLDGVCSRAMLFGSGEVFRSVLDIESKASRNKAEELGMAGQVVGGLIARVAVPGFAISRWVKESLAAATVTVASVTMMTALAMMSQASAQSFTQALVFGDSSVDSGFYKALGSRGGGR